MKTRGAFTSQNPRNGSNNGFLLSFSKCSLKIKSSQTRGIAGKLDLEFPPNLRNLFKQWQFTS